MTMHEFGWLLFLVGVLNDLRIGFSSMTFLESYSEEWTR